MSKRSTFPPSAFSVTHNIVQKDPMDEFRLEPLLLPCGVPMRERITIDLRNDAAMSDLIIRRHVDDGVILLEFSPGRIQS